MTVNEMNKRIKDYYRNTPNICSDYEKVIKNYNIIFGEDKDENKSEKPVKEMVNHPSHYQGNKFEVIDIIEDYHLGFCLGNAIKYILRAGKKDNIIQDINKAIWYLERFKKENKNGK